MADDAGPKVDKGLSNVLQRLSPLGLRWSLVFLPWKLALQWLSICVSFCSELCCYAGAPPSGYMTKNQASQMNTVSEHLHKRLAAQDKMLQQLHNDVDQLSRDKRKAMTKYQRTKKELDVVQARAMPELPDYDSSSPKVPQRHYAMHVSVGLAAMCAWWYYLQDVPSLERKLLSVLLFPLGYFYVSSLITQWRQWSSIFMYCAAWFLIGFVQCRRLGQYYV
ncbi:hypothetical protein ABBQ32_005437 [Trebouxia sp. C0010 RCD-2024]